MEEVKQECGRWVELATGILTPILIHALYCCVLSGAGHMCGDPSAWHLGHCILCGASSSSPTEQLQERPQLPTAAFRSPVGTHQTMCEISFLLLSQHIFPRGGPIGGQRYASIWNHLVHFSQLFIITL